MYSVYVLQSGGNSNLYIEYAGNIHKRLIAHRNGLVQSAAYRRPLTLIFYEEYQDKYEAFCRDRYYKTAKGKRKLLNKIHCSGIV